MNCSIHGTHGNFSHSTRKHGRIGRMFVICGYCGEELQATSNGIFDTNPAKNRADPKREKSISLRITDKTWKKWKASGFSAGLIFEIGLSSVLQ